MSDVSDNERESDPPLEIYVRMNDDPEKDYCFTVGMNDTFESLLKIFHILKLSLRPSVFYENIPAGFQVSVDPGLLTDTGGLLFSEKAHNNVKDVKLTDKISDFACPGQLILPVWKTDKQVKYTILYTLLFWLYTDLPDFISPTPGISLTCQIAKVLAFVLRNFFDQQELADEISSQAVSDNTKVTAQIIFFVFHIFKVSFIFVSFWSGVLNPYSLNPLKTYRINKTEKLDEAKRQQLISVGWSGSRKATLEEYRTFIRDFEIEKYGSILNASKNGLFERLKKPAIQLQKGEGFDSDLSAKTTLKDLEANPEKYVLSYELFAENFDNFKNYLDSLLSPAEINKEIKMFRKYGPLRTTERLANIIKKRREFDDKQKEEAKEKVEKKNE